MLPHDTEFKPLQRYLMEALGLGIFMVSIALFGSLFLSPLSPVYQFFPDETFRIFLLGIFMAATALLITVSPFTKPSGAHINPAVTICFLRLGRISRIDAFFYILFQTAGGTIAVFLMAAAMQSIFVNPPIHYAVTQPGKYGVATAFITEFIISAGLMLLILFGNTIKQVQKKLPFYIAALIFIYVNASVTLSGFSMNPARSFASAFPAGDWKFFWLYCIAPLAGMMAATETYLLTKTKYHESSIG